MSSLPNLSRVVLLLSVCGPVLSAQSADDLLREGSRFFAGNNSDAAIAAFRRAVELRPKFAAAWKALGVTYASRGDIDLAEPAFRNACEFLPSLEDACLYHGRTLYLMNRFPSAVESLRRALKVRESGEVHRLIALCLEGMSRPVEAEPEFRSALRLTRGAPADEDPGIDYGVFLYRQARPEPAIEALTAALERHPDSARGHLELGCVLLSVERLTEAAAHLERSLALRDMPRTHQLLAKTYLRQGKPELAAPHLSRNP